MQQKRYPTISQIRETYDRVMSDTAETRRVIAERRKREAANRPTIGPIIAHAGASTEQWPYRHVTAADIDQAIAARHAHEKVEAQARELAEINAQIVRAYNAKGRSSTAEPQTLDEAQSAIMAQFTTPKPAALAIREFEEYP